MHVIRYASCKHSMNDNTHGVSKGAKSSSLISHLTFIKLTNNKSSRCNQCILNQDNKSLEKSPKINTIYPNNVHINIDRSQYISINLSRSYAFKRRKIIANQSIILLLLLSLAKLISSLAISPPSREIALLRLGRTTTVDDDELARTMSDRSGPGQDEDEPISSSVELARTRDLLQAQESSRSKSSEQSNQDSSQTTASATTTTIQALNATRTSAHSGASDFGDLYLDSQISSVNVAAPVESAPFISVINNQSSSIQLGDSSSITTTTTTTPPPRTSNYQPIVDLAKQHLQGDFIESSSSNMELLHNVSMNEPADTIKSLQAQSSISSSNAANDTEIMQNEQLSNSKIHNNNGFDKR